MDRLLAGGDRRALGVSEEEPRAPARADRAHLEARDQLNYDLYLDLLQTAVEGLRFHNDAMPLRFVTAANLMMPINQMGGVQQDVPRIIGAMATATRRDYEDIIARLRASDPSSIRRSR